MNLLLKHSRRLILGLGTLLVCLTCVPQTDTATEEKNFVNQDHSEKVQAETPAPDSSSNAASKPSEAQVYIPAKKTLDALQGKWKAIDAQGKAVEYLVRGQLIMYEDQYKDLQTNLRIKILNDCTDPAGAKENLSGKYFSIYDEFDQLAPRCYLLLGVSEGSIKLGKEGNPAATEYWEKIQ